MKDRTARGTALVNLITLAQDERIQAIIDTRTYEEGAFLFFMTKNGMVKKTQMTEYDTSCPQRPDRHQPRSQRRARPGHPEHRQERRRHGHAQRPDDPVLRERRAGRRAEPPPACAGMKLKQGDDAVVAAATSYRRGAVMLFISSSGHGKRTKLDSVPQAGPWRTGRTGYEDHGRPRGRRRILYRD